MVGTMSRKLAAEFLGTAILVFFAVGVATLMFGFKFAGASVAAGVVVTALAFGLTLLALVYMIGPISGSHVNPALDRATLAARPGERRHPERVKRRPRPASPVSPGPW
jgi:aquaporin Z